MTRSNTENEIPVYEEMFKTLLRTPHRQVDEILDIHKEQFGRNPEFYGKLAIYAVKEGNCVIRDVNEVFIAMLLASPFRPHQEAGYVLFQDLKPYNAARVARYFTGYDEVVKRFSYEGSPPTREKNGVKWVKGRYSSKHPDQSKRGKVKPSHTIKLSRNSKLRRKLIKNGKIRSTDTEFSVQEYLVHHKCLNRKNFKGALRAAAKSYLKYREQNAAFMEGAILRAHKYIKSFYVRTNTLPMNDENCWINRFLWKGEVEEGSRLAALRSLQKEKDPIKQAEIIMDNRLPYPSVSSLISNFTPSIWVAVVNAMSPQELWQSVNKMKTKGAFDHKEIRNMINEKLKDIGKADKKKVDALKGEKVLEVVEGLDEETRSIIEDVTNKQLKQHGEIGLKTALLIDKSGSMTNAIELGKRLAAAIAQACRKGNDPIVYLFDNFPTLIEWNEEDGDIAAKSAWDKKLSMTYASGGTSPASVVRAMMTKDIQVEQMILVTDEGENYIDQFSGQLKEYEKKYGYLPSVVVVRIGTYYKNRMVDSLKKQNVNVDVLECNDIDAVAIPNLINLLSRKSIFDLVQDILALKLPPRAAWDKKHLKKKELVRS